MIFLLHSVLLLLKYLTVGLFLFLRTQFLMEDSNVKRPLNVYYINTRIHPKHKTDLLKHES